MEIERRTSAVDQMVGAAREAWKNWDPEQSAAKDPLPRSPSYNPASHWKSYFELLSTAASFVSLHVVSQRLMGNDGLFLFAGLIMALPLIKETAPSAIRGAIIRFFRA